MYIECHCCGKMMWFSLTQRCRSVWHAPFNTWLCNWILMLFITQTIFLNCVMSCLMRKFQHQIPITKTHWSNKDSSIVMIILSIHSLTSCRLLTKQRLFHPVLVLYQPCIPLVILLPQISHGVIQFFLFFFSILSYHKALVYVLVESW